MECRLTVKSGYARFTVGDNIRLSWSKTLSYYFGFENSEFKSGTFIGKQTISPLVQPAQRVFLLTDLIKPVPYKDSTMCLLQDFLYEYGGKDILERRFEPISYVPVIKQHIRVIPIQLLNEGLKPILLHDAKTLVTLNLHAGV